MNGAQDLINRNARPDQTGELGTLGAFLPAEAHDSAQSDPPASAQRRHVLILAGDTDHNLGDRAILQATCAEIRAAHPGAAFTVISASRKRAHRAYGADAIPLGPRGFFQLCAAAARSDLILCGGGGLFQDDDSLIKMPYWGLRVALMRLLNRRIIGYSLGVGPLDAASSRWFARLAFACMERVAVRDPKALRITRQLTGRPVELVPDPALLLRPVEPEIARQWLRDQGVTLDGRPLIGVALRRWFPPRRRIVPNRISARFRRRSVTDEPEAQRLTTLLAQVLDRIAEQQQAEILFLPTYTLAHEGDDRICQAVLAKMTSATGRVLRIDDPTLYKGVAGELSVLLGGRMHPTIFAAAAGTPVVGLAYNPKFHGFFTLLGLEDRVLDIATFLQLGQVDELAGLLAAAIKEGPRLGERIDALQQDIRRFNSALFKRDS
ncbi:polysaccharide pyruvyl transferase family protein [Rhodospirillaceae bacterium SYSU D60014]|uniref:polysaccharide pyruvyl transferase family protein n=1 Tax=Virgifigura deserti TaxID=2268457 RepID=UPI000E65F288